MTTFGRREAGGVKEMLEPRWRRAREAGFTLVELLVVIVVAGILAAVAVVGVAGVTQKGGTSACDASKDAALAASVLHFADTDKYPQTFSDFTTAEFQVPSGLTLAAPTKLSKPGAWTLTMQPSGPTNLTTFSC